LKELNPIIEYIQKELIEVINLGKYDEIYKSHLKEIFLLIGDKKFPQNWQELVIIFTEIFKVQTENLLSNENTFNLLCNMNELFYHLLKQNNRKRTPLSRSKFLQFKSLFLEIFCPFYERITRFFNENSQSFNNLEFIMRFLNLLITNDKILLVLIDSCFNVNDFHKDEKLIFMLQTILDRAGFLVQQIESTQGDIKEVLLKNLFKIIKYLGKIQSSSPVIFYKDLSKYVNILTYVILNCNQFNHDVLKATFFDLYKIINTISYKELSEEYMLQRKYSLPSNNVVVSIIGDNSRTPEKPKRPLSLVSPSKFKNFEVELKDANEIFYSCFTEENINQLIKSILYNVPFLVKKETDNLELELLADIEEEMVPSETFSTNTMSWQMLYKNLLESLIANFPEFCLKYIKEILETLYSGSQDQSINNILLIDSIIYFVNLLPGLYKNGVISEVEMIDYSKFINYVESILNKSEILMKKYIVTISKWCEVFITSDQIFNYFENLLFFLKNSKNNVILLECCLAIKNIVTQFDNFLKPGYQTLNMQVDKRKLEENMRNKINWGDVLTSVSTVCLSFISNVKSAELMLVLINLFTGLLQKCHFQCDGKIIEIIQNSKFTEIIEKLNTDFAQHAFIEMWKSLLVSFPNSSIILDLTLQFTSITLKKEINIHNLGLLLFAVRIVDTTDEIRSLLLNFLKEHIVIFQSNQKQYLMVILMNILEELSLLDIFDVNDVGNIISLCESKYIPLHELTKELYTKYIQDINSQLNINSTQSSNDDIIYGDVSEYKSAIINVVSTIYTFFISEKQIDISNHYRNFLKIILEETVMSKEGPSSLFSTVYLSSIIPLMNRISAVNFEFFKEILNQFFNEKGITFEQFFMVWLNRMEQMINIESR
jgi:hypothetical protein